MSMDGRIRLATIRATAGYVGASNILASHAVPAAAVRTKSGDSSFIVQGCFDTGGGVLSYTGPDGTNKIELNSGIALDADKAFAFPIEAIDGVDYDFQYSVGARIREFIVTEVTRK